MSDIVFWISFAPLLALVVCEFWFYYIILHELFLSDGESDGATLKLILLLVFFKIGFFIVFIRGWLHLRATRFRRVLRAWTMSLVSFIGCFVFQANLPDSIPSQTRDLIASGWACAITAASLVSLVRHSRIERRTLRLREAPSDETVQEMIRIGNKAIPALRDSLEDSDANVRTAATDVLGRIGTVEVIPLLQIAAKDSDAVVRQVAEAAIQRIQSGRVAQSTA